MHSRLDIFGTFTAKPHPFVFKRRGSNSKSHQAAVQMLLAGKAAPVAPSVGAFQAVLAHFQEGKARSSAGVQDVGKRKKVRVMGFCLAEAVRMSQREFIAGARSLTIMQDSRKHKLLMRFKAANDDLDVREGVLGHIQLKQGAGADDLMKASMRIITNFCTPLLGAPRNRAPRVKVDQALLKAVLHKIERYAADAAPDEQLAGNLLRGRPYRAPSVKEMWSPLPNLRIVSREHFIVNMRIKDMSMCACRFDSHSKPTGRGVLFYEPCLLTAMQIAQVRRGSSEGDIAADFLDYVDEEKLLQLGMLADAGDEALAHTRICDADDLDEAELPSHNAFFLQRIAMLFVESHCYDLGYTKFVHDALVRRPVTIFVRGHPRTIGGPGSVTPEIKERCRNRMVAWCRLAQATVKAEWPDFEVMAAFDAFNLQTVGRHAPETKTANKAHCEMIANTLGLDLPALLNGYSSVLPVALQKKKASLGLSNVEAWKMAMSQFKAARKETTQISALRAALVRYAAWVGSSSRVERSFKQFQWAVEQRRSSCSDALENDEIQLVCWEKCMDKSTIAEVAQVVWQLCKYGNPRTPGPWGRVDKGVSKKNIKRKAAALMDSENVRRESVRGGGWTDSHSRQETTLKHKRMEYFVDSIMDGTTSVKDLSEEMCHVVLQEVERRRKASLSRSAKWRRNGDAFAGPKRSLEGLRLFVEKDVDVCEVDLVRSIRKDNMARTTDRSQADIYVVGMPAAVSQRTGWARAMRGGVVSTLEFAMSHAEQGTAIAYECAAKKRRQVFAADSFIEAHPVVYDVIHACSTMQGNTWTWLKSANDVRDKSLTLKQAGREAELLALVSPREKRDLPE
ncbi:unnamed protein product, partial [Prorocentrum cordatum]